MLVGSFGTFVRLVEWLIERIEKPGKQRWLEKQKGLPMTESEKISGEKECQRNFNWREEAYLFGGGWEAWPRKQ